MDDIWRAFLATLLLVALPLTSASAHRLRAFAFAEGAVIHGYVCFGSNGPAQGAYIRALDPNGALIAETTSDADGRFSIVAQRRVDYRTIRFSSLPLNYSVQIDAQGNVTDAVAVVAIVEG